MAPERSGAGMVARIAYCPEPCLPAVYPPVPLLCYFHTVYCYYSGRFFLSQDGPQVNDMRNYNRRSCGRPAHAYQLSMRGRISGCIAPVLVA